MNLRSQELKGNPRSKPRKWLEEATAALRVCSYVSQWQYVFQQMYAEGQGRWGKGGKTLGLLSWNWELFIKPGSQKGHIPNERGHEKKKSVYRQKKVTKFLTGVTDGKNKHSKRYCTDNFAELMNKLDPPPSGTTTNHKQINNNESTRYIEVQLQNIKDNRKDFWKSSRRKRWIISKE